MSYLNGMAPGWGTVPFKTVVSRAQYGLSLSASEEGNTPILKMNSINGSGLSLESLDTVACDDATRERFRVKKGDLLFNRTNSKDLVGKAAVALEDTQAVFASYIVRFQLNKRMHPRFAGYWFQTEWVKARLQAIATPGVSQWNINPTTLQKALCVPDVPIKEQEKIVEILGACDKTIQAQDKLFLQKQQWKRGFAQHLLQFIVSKESIAGWKHRSLGNLLTFTPRKRPKPEVPFRSLGIRSHAKGTFLKPALDPDEIALDELFEVKMNDVIVNISFAWEHAIAVAKESDDGALVSHRFPTFVCKAGRAAPTFFRHFVQHPRLKYDLKCVSPGGAGRNRVLNKKDFLRLVYAFPEYQEQQRIGLLLDALDQELALQKQKLDQLKQQKRGLMQILLTGKVRVKV